MCMNVKQNKKSCKIWKFIYYKHGKKFFPLQNVVAVDDGTDEVDTTPSYS